MSPKQNLSTYSTEMLKIRATLYPDSQRVADAIFGQIELLVDMIIDTCRSKSSISGCKAIIYKPAAHLTSFTFVKDLPGGDVKIVVFTMDHTARVVHSPITPGYNAESAVLEPKELMDIHENVAECYDALF